MSFCVVTNKVEINALQDYSTFVTDEMSQNTLYLLHVWWCDFQLFILCLQLWRDDRKSRRWPCLFSAQLNHLVVGFLKGIEIEFWFNRFSRILSMHFPMTIVIGRNGKPVETSPPQKVKTINPKMTSRLNCPKKKNSSLEWNLRFKIQYSAQLTTGSRRTQTWKRWLWREPSSRL